MENINDPNNIMGMADIYADDNEMLDSLKIEKKITSSGKFSLENLSRIKANEPKEYETELDNLLKLCRPDTKQSQHIGSSSYMNPNIISTTRNSFNDDDGFGAKSSPKASPKNDYSRSTPKASPKATPRASPRVSIRGSPVASARGSPIRPRTYIGNFNETDDERRSRQVDKVIKNSNDDKYGGESRDRGIDYEELEEEEMAQLVEQIDTLRVDLADEEIDLSRIPEVSPSTTKKEAKAILRILRIKYNKSRYCDLFDEAILAGSYGLEKIFDGKNEWFGNKIDLTGWSETVKSKLKKIRPDTSTLVSNVVKDYDFGPLGRILLVILQSLLFHSRSRRLKSNDNLSNDDQYRDALRKINLDK